MPRRKSPSGKPDADAQFTHSPFKSLKELSVSKPEPAKDNAERDTRVTARGPGGANGDLQSFAEEMHSLGVQPLGRGDATPASPSAQAPPTREAAVNDDEKDRRLFLDALNKISAPSADDRPAEEPGGQASPRRLRQVARGQLSPEAELDLHGLTADAAVAKARFFVEDARYRGLMTLLIITGRGLHSPEGPVLRQAVMKLLSQMHEQVLEWGSAPRRYGGDGAVVIFLRFRPDQ